MGEIRSEEGYAENTVVYMNSSLSIWYNKILSKSLPELADGDVAKLIRQELHLNYVIDEAVSRLWENPVSGEKYDGELINSLNEIDDSFWLNHSDIKNKVAELIDAIKSSEIDFPDDFEWLYDGAEEEYFETLEILLRKLSTL